MSRSRTRAFPPASLLLPLVVLACTLCPPLPVEARNRAAPSAPDLCRQAAETAADRTGVPLRVLLALTLTETGRVQAGVPQPWPWALNQGGESLWFPSRSEAMDHLETAVANGATNIDIGCFQLNYRWHGGAFASLEEMMDPTRNALYAAQLLAGHAAEQGDWITAAGAYHSATPDKAKAYLARFTPIYAGLGDTPPATPTGADPEAEENSFPLLLAGEAASAGSIVPRRTAGRALIWGP